MAFSKKKDTQLWIWIALNPFTMEPIGFRTGKRGKKDFKIFYHDQLSHLKVKKYSSDKLKAYLYVKEQGQALVQHKAYTTHIESFNSLVRHYLARFRRKTRCYSKSADFVRYSLILLFSKLKQKHYKGKSR